MVATKAFVISMLMMPLLLFGGVLASELLQNAGSSPDKRIVVIDHSRQLFPLIQQKMKESSALSSLLFNDSETSSSDSESESDETDAETSTPNHQFDEMGPFQSRANYELEEWEATSFSDEDRLTLSQQLKTQELYAFVEIPADIMESQWQFLNLKKVTPPPPIKFYSEDVNFSEAKFLIGGVINELVKANRLKQQNIDPNLVAMASQPVPIQGFGPVEKSPLTGKIEHIEEKKGLRAIFLPLGVMMLMFMVIFMASQPMLECVLEEKSQRIAEVLLGSVNAYQLMTGKLLGTVAGSLTIFTFYLTGTFGVAWYRGFTDQIPLGLIPWFIAFQLFGVLFFASIFLAVGAAVTQLKEAQSLLLPVWMLLMSPMFVWFTVIREPNGPMATYFSLFPPATPTMMMLRMSTEVTIPLWQPLLGLFLLVLSAALTTYVASRVFRVGLLWQGKTPKFSEIVRWAFRG